MALLEGPQTQSCPSSSLEVVALRDIVTHEHHDPERAERLAQEIARTGCQIHPVVLAQTHYGPPVHLDGAHRIAALSRLDCQHIVAQLLDYADPSVVSLGTWLHVTRLSYRTLLEAARNWRKCDLLELHPHEALDAIDKQQAVAALFFADGKACVVLSSLAIADRVMALQQFTQLYSSTVHREIPSPEQLVVGVPLLLDTIPSANVCVAFAPFSKSEIITLAYDLHDCVPPGITRHMITCGRILNVNASLQLLRASIATSEKTAQLRQSLIKRRYRTYKEPTISYEVG